MIVQANQLARKVIIILLSDYFQKMEYV
jgi:hypothetical protein